MPFAPDCAWRWSRVRIVGELKSDAPRSKRWTVSMVTQRRVFEPFVVSIALKLTVYPDAEWVIVNASAAEPRGAEERGIELLTSVKRNALSMNASQAA